MLRLPLPQQDLRLHFCSHECRLDKALFLCLCVFDSVNYCVVGGRGTGQMTCPIPPASSAGLIVGAIVLLGRAGTATWPLGMDSFLLDNLISFPISPVEGNQTKPNQNPREVGEVQAGPRDTWVLWSIPKAHLPFPG